MHAMSDTNHIIVYNYFYFHVESKNSVCNSSQNLLVNFINTATNVHYNSVMDSPLAGYGILLT